MHIEVIADDSISGQARTYAEYRLFAALTQFADTNQVRNASVALRSTKSRRECDGVVCTVTVELHDGAVTRLRTYGDHPYAAVNSAVERLRSSCPGARRPATLSG